MVEIAICLAIIGFALVAIIGVLPIGMNTQRDNREETIINQDATEFMEAIRNGAQGLDDLTNYVYAITNFWAVYDSSGVLIHTGVSGYTAALSTVSVDGGAFAATTPQLLINNGTNIVGLLSTPEFTMTNGLLIPTIIYGGVSNHIVAYVRSISGPAVEKPPQDNQIIQADAFGYRVLCVNAPVAAVPNLAFECDVWQPQTYNGPKCVFSDWAYWKLDYGVTAYASDVPGLSAKWRWQSNYSLLTTPNIHELRLTFLWPQLANGGVGSSRQTYRTMVAGKLAENQTNTSLYFYQPQSFNNAK
jgi:type II secretory pathway pseudopilin PulG